jgi:hypothetical protein
LVTDVAVGKNVHGVRIILGVVTGIVIETCVLKKTGIKQLVTLVFIEENVYPLDLTMMVDVLEGLMVNGARNPSGVPQIIVSDQGAQINHLIHAL